LKLSIGLCCLARELPVLRHTILKQVAIKKAQLLGNISFPPVVFFAQPTDVFTTTRDYIFLKTKKGYFRARENSPFLLFDTQLFSTA
jgi:hypothetical protein